MSKIKVRKYYGQRADVGELNKAELLDAEMLHEQCPECGDDLYKREGFVYHLRTRSLNCWAGL